MTELLRQWILGLSTAAIITAGAQRLTPAGPVKKVLQLVCGIVLTSVLLSPLGELDMERYSLSLASYHELAAELTAELEEGEKRMDRLYIEEQCAAYILDEAHALGLEGRVEVSAKWRDDCWVPWEVRISMNGTEQQHIRLRRQIEAELGIAEERQSWDGNGT